jgi:hypothetical protein
LWSNLLEDEPTSGPYRDRNDKKTKHSNNPIENRTRDIPACGVVPLDILPKLNNNTPKLWQVKTRKKPECINADNSQN